MKSKCHKNDVFYVVLNLVSNQLRCSQYALFYQIKNSIVIFSDNLNRFIIQNICNNAKFILMFINENFGTAVYV